MPPENPTRESLNQRFLVEQQQQTAAFTAVDAQLALLEQHGLNLTPLIHALMVLRRADEAVSHTMQETGRVIAAEELKNQRIFLIQALTVPQLN